MFFIVIAGLASATARPVFLDYTLNLDLSVQPELSVPERNSPEFLERNSFQNHLKKIGFRGNYFENNDRFLLIERGKIAGSGFRAPENSRITVVDTELLKRQYNFSVIFFGNACNWSVGIAGESNQPVSSARIAEGKLVAADLIQQSGRMQGNNLFVNKYNKENGFELITSVDINF